jgi:hypothetical protein
LLRLEGEWEVYQSTHARDAVYGYLSLVFETAMAWTLEGRAVNRAYRALRLRGVLRSESRSRSRPSFIARPIMTRLMIGREANGDVCCGMPQNIRIWLNRWVISLDAKVASTNSRRGLLVVLVEVASIGLHSPIAVSTRFGAGNARSFQQSRQMTVV